MIRPTRRAVSLVAASPLLALATIAIGGGLWPAPVAYLAAVVLAILLDGLRAMEYVRSRHSDLQGDVGRSKRQQQVLLSLRTKAKYISPADIPDLAATFNGEFKTSIPLDRVRRRFGDPTRPGFSRKFFKPLWTAAGIAETT